MKLVKLSIALAASGALCATTAWAQQLQQPFTVRTVAAERAYYDVEDDVADEAAEGAAESASDVEVAEPPAIEDDYDKVDSGKDDFGKDDFGKCGGKGGKGGCGGGGLLPCATGDPVSMWDAVMGCRESRIDIGGWVQAGFYNYNTGMFNNYPNNFNMNQMWLYAERALDTSCGWDWGFRVDGVYGTDGPDTQAFGNPPDTYDFGWNYGNFYGTAIPQAYAEVGFNDLSVKVGHFYTICGYEVVPATGNFFYSHAFTMYYAEPFTHTGALATYEAGENMTVYGGWTKGWDTGFETFGGDTFLGGFSVGVTENITATYTTTFGNIGFGTNASGYSHSIVIDTQLTDRLNYVFQTDFVDYRGAVSNPAVGFPVGTPALSHRYGVNNYLFYTINDCLAAGVRLEWFNVEQTMAARSDLYEITVGLKYQPIPNFIIRPELRWDKDDDGFTVAAGRNDTLGFGMDMILTF